MYLYLVIKDLNPNKAHSCGSISTRMIQLCGKSLTVPLKLIFQTNLIEGKFPKNWKKSNVVPVYKK